MITKPTAAQLNELDLEQQYKRIRNGRATDFFMGSPGIEHYRLLAWISNQVNNIRIAEIGTLDGCGLLALSHNPHNQIVSYDIRFYDDCAELPYNAERRLVGDGWMDEVAKASIIFYDADHNGEDEQQFVKELIKREWKGVLILDDIFLNQPMRLFWNWCKTLEGASRRCEDWSDVGHSCGTGIIFFE